MSEGRAERGADREPTLAEIGDTAGDAPDPSGLGLWGVLALLAITFALGIFGGYSWGERSAERAASAPAQWSYVGGPDTSRGGAYVYTRCDGPTRLFLTVGADGFPAGPAGLVTFAQGSGCPR